LITAALIALVSGDVLGLAAANHWTELAWGVVGVVLVLAALLAHRRRVVARTEPVAPGETVAPAETPAYEDSAVASSDAPL
jgi:hypothetical protein